MRYKLLGRTGLFISELGLGTDTFGGQTKRWETFGALGRVQATEMVGEAINAGVNLIDTADTYGDGEAEIRVGQALQDLAIARSEVILVTKVSDRVGPAPNAVGASRSHILNGIEASLRRLGTDYIDLYLIHQFDPATPLDETLRALDMLVRQGKVRYVGCSNFFAWQVALALGVSERDRFSRFAAVEASYTIAAREVERELIPMLLNQEIGLIVWGGLAYGLLTGKYGRDGSAPEVGRLNSSVSVSSAHTNRERAFNAVDAMRPIAGRRGVSIAQIAIAWLLQQKGVTSVLLGTRLVSQLRDNLGAIDIRLSEEELAELGKPGALPIEYPAWMQNSRAIARHPGQKNYD